MIIITIFRFSEQTKTHTGCKNFVVSVLKNLWINSNKMIGSYFFEENFSDINTNWSNESGHHDRQIITTRLFLVGLLEIRSLFKQARKYQKLTVDISQNVNQAFYYGLGHCQTANGTHFEHLIKIVSYIFFVLKCVA